MYYPSLPFCVLAKSFQSYPTLRDPPWAIVHQAPLSMGFSRPEYWSGLPCPTPGDLPNIGMEAMSQVSCIGRQVLYH